MKRRVLLSMEPTKTPFQCFLLTRLKHFMVNEWNEAKAKQGEPGSSIVAPRAASAETPAKSAPQNKIRPEQVYCNFDFGGMNARAALYGGPTGSTESQLSFLASSVGFHNPSFGPGYVDNTTSPFNPQGSTRILPTVLAGSPAVFQIRAWDTGAAGTLGTSYEDAKAIILSQNAGYLGVSALVNVPALGDTGEALPLLIGLQPFSISWVPEPSVIVLELLVTVAGIVVFRRRA